MGRERLLTMSFRLLPLIIAAGFLTGTQSSPVKGPSPIKDLAVAKQATELCPQGVSYGRCDQCSCDPETGRTRCLLFACPTEHQIAFLETLTDAKKLGTAHEKHGSPPVGKQKSNKKAARSGAKHRKPKILA